MHRKSSRQNIIYALLGISLFLLIWQITAAYLIDKSWLLPTPAAVIKSFFANIPLLWHHSVYTLAETFIGLTVAIVLSIAFALLMSLFPAFRKTVYPLLLGSQMVPIIVLAPLFIIWFGYGLLPKILVVVLICFFPMTINILSGLAATDGETIAFYRAMGMNSRQLFRLLRLPQALPHFFSGLRVSAVYSVMGAVIGEWLGAKAGLGQLLLRAQNSFNLPLVFAAILAIIIWSALIFALVKLAERHCLFWRKYLDEASWHQ
jgi:ABC-type nitrate/sulfonate/bicarbonate transport system permease component